MSVGCNKCFIVLTVKLTKLTLGNHPFIRVSAGYVHLSFSRQLVWELYGSFRFSSKLRTLRLRASGSSQGLCRFTLCRNICYSIFSSFSLLCGFCASRVKGTWHTPIPSGPHVPSNILLFSVDLRSWPPSTHFLRGSVSFRGMCSCPISTGYFF